jgi:hypothetical protein
LNFEFRRKNKYRNTSKENRKEHPQGRSLGIQSDLGIRISAKALK